MCVCVCVCVCVRDKLTGQRAMAHVSLTTRLLQRACATADKLTLTLTRGPRRVDHTRPPAPPAGSAVDSETDCSPDHTNSPLSPRQGQNSKWSSHRVQLFKETTARVQVYRRRVRTQSPHINRDTYKYSRT